MTVQMPLFLSTDALALIQWARSLPGDGSRWATYVPKHKGGLQTGEFTESEAMVFFGGTLGDRESMEAGRARWERVKDELGLRFDHDRCVQDERGVTVSMAWFGAGMVTNFTWGCWKLTKAADIVPEPEPDAVVAL
jgi:hypothetical protein